MENKLEIDIVRLFQIPFEKPVQTMGELYAIRGNNIVYTCKTLELPWKDNKNRVSCIPADTYPARVYNSPTKGEVLLLENVPNRSYIEFHDGNFHTDILGCIISGNEVKDINGDGVVDVIDNLPLYGIESFDKVMQLVEESGQEFVNFNIKWRAS